METFMNYLLELERLTRSESAKLTIIIDRGVPCVRWSRGRGRHAEIITEHFKGSIAPLLTLLLERLGWQGVPTTELIFERMTPPQRIRAGRLFTQWRALKAVVLRPETIEQLEPRLASPRSSLNPQFMLDAEATR
jgi:hypothetical protein